MKEPTDQELRDMWHGYRLQVHAERRAHKEVKEVEKRSFIMWCIVIMVSCIPMAIFAMWLSGIPIVRSHELLGFIGTFGFIHVFVVCGYALAKSD